MLPLAFGMVPDELRALVFARLVDKIENETKGHIGTGLIGGQYLMRVLSDNGRADLAYTIAPRCDARGNCEVERASFWYVDANGALREGHIIGNHTVNHTDLCVDTPEVAAWTVKDVVLSVSRYCVAGATVRLALSPINAPSAACAAASLR